MRFEIQHQDSIFNESTGSYESRFKVLDNEAPNYGGETDKYVRDQSGNDTFTDSVEYSDVPSYVPKFVTLYEISRDYGGPEEGGWWYDSYHVVESIQAYGCSVDEVKAFLLKNHRIDLDRECTRYNVRGPNDHIILVELNSGEMSEREIPRYE